MPRFLVEVYVSRSAPERLQAAAARAREASAEVSTDGATVRYVRSIFVPEDEIGFHLFEGDSREPVARVAELARLEEQRIVEVVMGEQAGT